MLFRSRLVYPLDSSLLPNNFGLMQITYANPSSPYPITGSQWNFEAKIINEIDEIPFIFI